MYLKWWYICQKLGILRLKQCDCLMCTLYTHRTPSSCLCKLCLAYNNPQHVRSQVYRFVKFQWHFCAVAVKLFHRFDSYFDCTNLLSSTEHINLGVNLGFFSFFHFLKHAHIQHCIADNTVSKRPKNTTE